MIWGRNSEMAVCECVGALSSVCLLLCSQGSKHLLNEEHSILFYQHLFSVKQFRTLGACCFWPLTAQWDTQGYISLQIFMLFNRETGQWGVLSGGEHKKISGRQSGRHKGRSFRKKTIAFKLLRKGQRKRPSFISTHSSSVSFIDTLASVYTADFFKVCTFNITTLLKTMPENISDYLMKLSHVEMWNYR